MRYLQEYLGETLREERLRQNLTMQDLSEIAHVSPSHICDTERGRKNLSSELLDSIISGLGISIKELLIRTVAEMESKEQRRELV